MTSKRDTAASFEWLLLISVFVVATCGLIYELVAGTLASYLLGDSVTQFSTIIGTYLFAMGIGSYLSKFLRSNLLSWFITIELLVGMVGGFSAGVLFILFEQVVYFRVILYALVVLTGTLVGLELPLLMRILKDRIEFSDLVSRIFTFDYIGALFASLLFPLIFIPYLGLLRTSFFFGFLNVSVAWVVAYRFKEDIRAYPRLKWSSIICLLLLATGFIFSEKLTALSETLTYPDKIVYAKSSPYQRIVLTRGVNDWRLFLNGNLQFSSLDEYRYHEALIHPGMSRLKNPENILVLGGGDGMAVREILKYPSVKKITLVDLDPSVTTLFRSNATLQKLNEHSLSSAKVSVINQDAFVWIRGQEKLFDFITIDFPDPSNYSLGKLYTTSFYRELHRILAPGGCLVIQSTSPFVARKSFWIIDATLHKAGFDTQPYHCYVPSFGEWGFVLAFEKQPEETYHFPNGLKFVNEASVAQLYNFPPDMSAVESAYNTLNNQVLVNTFEKEWADYTR
ncbi:polyamine aminopropyltransferase [Chryseolinea lacunae]|uniref:Polyamine aminopropyltransferase n=1 Tax=Chryseolinea lacunae TaxID=2801331 RepID=A0ABS1KS61_9BACT|nr:polyamine aminopropyltransferase [Chryseolinea lacunae]MBL0742033.1 polyamine aminopropyltransferase [Chryseolinea lacunae]